MKKGWYIFTYHNVSWEENPFIRGIDGETCPPDVFRDHLAYLNKAGEFVSIQEGLRRFESGDVNNLIFSFWFDDGLVGVRKYALPLLNKYKTTGALSICSRFWNREEFFWRFKLSYLSYVDGLRFLRARLNKYGYETGMSIKKFTFENFSESIVEEIDNIYRKFASELERNDAFRLFETKEGLLELKKRKWILSNHTASHYPISEDSFIDNFEKQFTECESRYKELFKEESKFWVLPFENFRTKKLIETFRQCTNKCTNNRYLVLCGNRINKYSNIKENVLFRIGVPFCTGNKLLQFIRGALNK